MYVRFFWQFLSVSDVGYHTDHFNFPVSYTHLDVYKRQVKHVLRMSEAATQDSARTQQFESHAMLFLKFPYQYHLDFKLFNN